MDTSKDRRLIRVLAILAVALGGAVLGAGAADAHAGYVRSNPAADARLIRAPTEVRAIFSEQPDPRGSELAVFDAQGKRVDRADTAASDEPNGLRVSLSEIGEGGYTVAWTVLSAVDGHTTKGSFVFAVGDAPLPAVPDVGEASPPPRALEIAGRALSFAAIALLVGGAAFALVVRPTRPGAEERREQLLLALGGALLVVGAVALLLEQGGRAPPRLTTLLGTRGLAGVAVLAAASGFALPQVRLVALGAGIVGVLTATLVSHAAASGVADIALDLAHTLAAATWAGGVAAMGAVLLPSAATLAPAELGRAVARFSNVGLAAVAVLVGTGAAQSFRRLVLIQDLWETPYGLALVAKIALLAFTLALAALNLFVWGPRLRRARVAGPSRRGLAWSVIGESALLATILVATGLLTAFAPPARASGAAFDETRHVQGLRLELLLASTSPGRNRYILRVHDGLEPVTDALRVAFRFTMIEHDMGENELVAEQRAPGEYVATGNATAMFGTWRIETIVRRPGSADVRTTFTVPVGAPTGPGAVARAVPAPPYTLVVFVDPSQPVAGAPLSVNVVVVDAAGDPVRGKQVRLTFAGPGSETADAAETSPGRYEAQVAALGVGRWTAAIAIGTEAKGEYVFEVGR